MKVLWITNIIFPEAAKLLGLSDSFCKSGGWMLASAQSLIENENIHLSAVSVSNYVSKLTTLHGEKIVYYIIPLQKKFDCYEQFMKQLKDLAQPDVIHIHGTELPFGKAYLNACGNERVIVSIQGLVSAIEHYYLANLSSWEIIRDITLRDVMRSTLFGEKRKFHKRGEMEKSVISEVKHVIGRTSFDKAHCLAINPTVHYHFCNESLRDEFYEGRWQYGLCQPHSLFLSQASYPLKGLHQLLKALPLVVRHFPDVQVRIAGDDITRDKTLEQRLRRSGYGKIIKRLIKENILEKHIAFTGALNAQQMRQEFLRANVFVCPSAIENSPNSLGEAQLLGVPCIASYVGGIPDMISSTDCGILYRFEETEMLADAICNAFEWSKKFDNQHMIEITQKRHNKSANTQCLIEIYQQLLK